MNEFLRSRLEAARDGRGNYKILSPEARQVAAEALAEVEANINQGRNAKAFVSEVRFPLYYASRDVRAVRFFLTFRRWR
jgi:hypothetical protein